MLIPADFLSGALMPWVLAAPALPLALMLFRKTEFNPLNISLLIVCIVSMMSNVFLNVLVQEPEDLQGGLYLFCILAEFATSMLLLWNCTANRMIRGMVLAVCVMFCGAIISLMMIRVDLADITSILSIGYLLIFALDIAAMADNAKGSRDFITDAPAFWYTAGMLFQYGMIAVLLIAHPDADPSGWLTNPQFGLMYTLVTCMRFILFSAGLLVAERNRRKSASAPR